MKRGAGLLGVLLAVGATCGTRPPRPVQPIAFNHQLHAGKHEIGCTTCHAGAERRPAAGLPALRTCLTCHMKPQGDPPSAAEGQVRELAGAGAPVRWVQVTRNPGHVFFSHAAHVTLGGISCSRCHGDVTRWKAPPEEPEARLRSMGACQQCHRDRGAPLGCATCHR
jgi:hypothetical protein